MGDTKVATLRSVLRLGARPNVRVIGKPHVVVERYEHRWRAELYEIGYLRYSVKATTRGLAIRKLSALCGYYDGQYERGCS